MAVAVLVALVAAVSYGILAGATQLRNTIRSQDDAKEASQATTVYPDPVACALEQLTVSLTAPETVAVGGGMEIAATVTNSGSEACLVDLGSASFAAVIRSGSDTVWSSASCPADPTEHLLLLDAGASASATVAWDGRRSDGSCAAPADGAEPAVSATTAETPADTQSPAPTETTGPAPGTGPLDPLVAQPGTYRARLQLGGQDVAQEWVFTIS